MERRRSFENRNHSESGLHCNMVEMDGLHFPGLVVKIRVIESGDKCWSWYLLSRHQSRWGRDQPGNVKHTGNVKRVRGRIFLCTAVGTGHIKVFNKPVLLTVFFSHYSFLLQSFKMCFVYDFSHFWFNAFTIHPGYCSMHERWWPELLFNGV